MNYTNYTNLDAHYGRPYEPGDRLVRGWTGEIPYVVTPELLMETAEALYTNHNRDSRPDGKLCPSMSIGDVIIIGEVALSVDHMGFKHVDVDSNDLITDKTWKECVVS